MGVTCKQKHMAPKKKKKKKEVESSSVGNDRDCPIHQNVLDT